MPDATRPLFSLLGAIVATLHGVMATSGRDGLEHGDAATWGIGEKNHVAASREGWYQQTTRIRHAIPHRTGPELDWYSRDLPTTEVEEDGRWTPLSTNGLTIAAVTNDAPWSTDRSTRTRPLRRDSAVHARGWRG